MDDTLGKATRIELCADMDLVTCPICSKRMTIGLVNLHLDNGCGETNASFSPPKETKANFDEESLEHPSANSSPKERVSQNPLFQNQPKKLEVPNNQNILKRPRSDVPQSENISTPKRTRTQAREKNKPLAELIRPKTLDEYIGQSDLVGPKGILKAFIERDVCPSIILWGPSGVCYHFHLK